MFVAHADWSATVPPAFGTASRDSGFRDDLRHASECFNC